MRALLLVALLGCSSGEAALTTDAAAPSCATTSCVPGATCRLPTGATCACFDAGAWSCGSGVEPYDTGTHFSFDAAAPDTEPRDLGTSVALDAANCESKPSVMCGESNPSPAVIASMMKDCSLYCAEVYFYAELTGCVTSLTFTGDVDAKRLACIRDRIGAYAWCPGGHGWRTTACPK